VDSKTLSRHGTATMHRSRPLELNWKYAFEINRKYALEMNRKYAFEMGSADLSKACLQCGICVVTLLCKYFALKCQICNSVYKL